MSCSINQCDIALCINTWSVCHWQQYYATTLNACDLLYSPVTSPANWLSSVMFSIPDARSLYTPSVSQLTHGVFPTLAVGYASSQQFAASRLPKLSLPTFSPLTWQTFWDSFYAAINANPNLSGIQKFNYLKAQLQGDAARAVSGLPLSDLN